MAQIQKITTNLWFNNQAEEAVNFYISIFNNSRILKVARYGKEGFEFHHKPEGTVMTMSFELEGQQFVALNGGPEFQFTEAISFIVNCENQAEVDHYWEKLSDGGDPNAQQCGWLKDKFGVSWQVVPVILAELLSATDKTKSQKVMKVLFSMKKLDIETLKLAHDQ